MGSASACSRRCPTSSCYRLPWTWVPCLAWWKLARAGNVDDDRRIFGMMILRRAPSMPGGWRGATIGCVVRGGRGLTGGKRWRQRVCGG